jgi:arsenate reductase
MKLYGIPNCSSVKKAREWLDSNNVAYEFHDFKKQGIDPTTLQNWLNQQPWEKLVNRAGMTWRSLSDAEKSTVRDSATAADLMQAKTSVIKRPVLVEGDRILMLGFDADKYRVLTNTGH